MKKILIPILLLFGLLIIPGCGGIAENEESRKLVNEFIQDNSQDKGLVWASQEAPIIDLTTIDQDIPFTVHQLIADSARVILIASWENEKSQPETATNYPTLKYISGQEISASSSISGTRRLTDNKVIYLLNLHTSLPPKENKLLISFDEIDGIEGNWSLEVPVFRPKNDHGIITNLSTKSDGFNFFASLTLGSTMTDIAWSLRDTFSEEQAENRGYYLAGTREAGQIWKDFNSILYPEQRIRLLNNEEVIPSYTQTGGGWSKNFISSNGFHLPVKEPGELKIILTNIAMQKTKPIHLKLERINNEWQEKITNIEDTTVKVENVDLQKGEITLSYQSGRLRSLGSPGLKDGQGNEYQCKDIKGEIPELEPLMHEIYEEQLGREEIVKKLNDLKRNQILYLEGLPLNTERLDLSFQEVIFLSKNQWELDVRY